MKPTPPLVTAAGLVVAAVLFAFGFWWADTRLTLATPHVALACFCFVGACNFAVLAVVLVLMELWRVGKGWRHRR
jgi:hypothetical protein